MNIKLVILCLSLFYSFSCNAQSSFKLNKKAKKALKTLQKEGWETIDEKGNLEEQFIAWHQLAEEASNYYIISYGEWESSNLQIAERRAWDGACSNIRNMEHSRITSSISVEESVDTQTEGKQETSSDAIVSQRISAKYVTTNTDLKKIFAVYKRLDNSYKVQIVVAKEIK